MRSVIAVAALAILITGCPKKNDAGDGGGTTGGAAAGSATSGGGLLAKGLSLIGAGPFSGEVDVMFKNDKGTGNGSIFVKGAKQRMEFSAPDHKTGAMIMDGAAKKMTVLDDGSKTAMVMTLDDSGKPSGAPGTTSGSGAPPKEHQFTRTGKKDVVAGYECEIWTYEEPDAKGELCVADGLTMLGMGKLGSFASALSGTMTGFPLRAIAQTKEGKEKDRFEVTKLERKDVPDDKFQVPPGYKIVNMEDMMKGLGGIGRPARR